MSLFEDLLKPQPKLIKSVSIPPGTLASRHNNPGNLIFAGQPNATQGEIRKDGTSWAKFDNSMNGYAALKRQMTSDQSTPRTLQGVLHKYAPPSENNTEKYLQFLEQRLKVKRSVPARDINPDDLTRYIAQYESGSKTEY